ncbi:MAG: nicotinate phosphoribosyltransferase, partial [Myxococcales bacterium]|nr:nicotinate phosphoribosyltransferase [Myxococcales bacterium]
MVHTHDSEPTGLQTDLYQLTMAQGYWKLGRADEEAVFHLGFRKHPFAGAFAIACGLEQAIDLVEGLGFSQAQRSYLASLVGNDGKALFDAGFLDWLGALRPTVDIDAMAEGTACFAHEPLLRVRGPLIQCQLLETALLTIINFQTLIATKAARIAAAAEGDPVLEFGLRRAQGLDGGLSASRAAYVGGCIGTSNVAAGARFGIPVRGTHAHAWVMSFAEEREAFAAYAEAMPNNCVFLVDTYDTLRGVERAVEIGKELRGRGHEMVGVRLDSGDLATLSLGARKILDAGGFAKAAIVASNDLDERRIVALKRAGAAIDVWGVGT